MCLAWQLTQSELTRPVSCLHIDHQLDRESHQRAARAIELAESLGLRCPIKRVTVPGSGSPEAAARCARYAALLAHLEAGETLLTAHHADDQVETVLLRLLRGSGPHGLAGIARISQQNQRWLVRPMLNWTRNRIQRTLEKAGLNWIDDPSNELEHFDRNYVRQTILPLMRSRWPGTDRAIVRSARLCRGAAEQIDQLVDKQLDKVRLNEVKLDLNRLLNHPVYLQGQILRAWCQAVDLTPPPGRRMDSFIDQLDQLAPDRQPELSWQDGCIRAWNQKLWLTNAEPIDPYNLRWQMDQTLTLPGHLGTLSLTGPPATDPAEILRVSSGQPGERLRLPGHRHHSRVSNLMQEAGVAPWERASWPRIYTDNSPDKRLLAVGDRWLSADFAWQLANNQQQLHWHRLDSDYGRRK